MFSLNWLYGWAGVWRLDSDRIQGSVNSLKDFFKCCVFILMIILNHLDNIIIKLHCAISVPMFVFDKH